MSHNQLRQDRNCLNCGNQVEERYCTHCGQENLKIQDSAVHLVIHYVQDLFHYDGRIWHTLKNLLLKPGMVPHEYMEGKRMRNLEPVRFYVFASTVFFLILFFTVNLEEINPNEAPEKNYARRLYNLNQEKKFLKNEIDTIHIHALTTHLQQQVDSFNKANPSRENKIELDLSTPLPNDTSGWLSRMLNERAEARREKMETEHQGDSLSAAEAFLSEVFHKLPLLLFLSMPFFALYLKLLYFTSLRKRYVEHFIFSIYHYSYLFTITSAYLIFIYGAKKINGGFLDFIDQWMTPAFILYLCVYLWLSMARFYGDRWLYRLPKYIVLMLFLMTTLLLLFFLILFLTIIS